MNFKLSLETVYGVIKAAYGAITIERNQIFEANLLNDLSNLKRES